MWPFRAVLKRLAPHARLSIVARTYGSIQGPEIRLQSTSAVGDLLALQEESRYTGLGGIALPGSVRSGIRHDRSPASSSQLLRDESDYWGLVCRRCLEIVE